MDVAAQGNRPNGDPDLDDAISGFMTQWSVKPDADKPSGDDEDKKKDETPPADGEDTPPEEADEDAEKPSGEADEEAEGEEEATDDEEPPKRKYGDDDTYVKVKVGDEEHEVPVKDLKRLWGQESALTRKSQEVATARQQAEQETARAVTATHNMLQRATARADQFRQIDVLTAAQHLNAEELNTLRTQAQAAFEEERFFKEELDGMVKGIATKQVETAKTEAAECIKQLTDPTSPTYVEDWSEKRYNDLRSFAVEQGLPAAFVNGIRVSGAFKLLDMAMKYAAGQKALTKTIKVKNQKPKKIIKSSTAPKRTSGDSTKKDAAMAKLRASGSQDDAANAFLARAGIVD